MLLTHGFVVSDLGRNSDKKREREREREETERTGQFAEIS